MVGLLEKTHGHHVSYEPYDCVLGQAVCDRTKYFGLI